jgi:hypothetical protein
VKAASTGSALLCFYASDASMEHTYFFFIMGAMHMGSDQLVLTATGFAALLDAGLLYVIFRRVRRKNKAN